MRATSMASSYITGPGRLKSDKANPGLARIFISFLYIFGDSFCLYIFSFSFELEWSETTQNLSSDKHFQGRKIVTSVNF